MATIARPFNALSGLEAKKIILNEIERELDADYRFKQHLTYPQISWEWALHVRCYPSDNPEFRIAPAGKTVRAPETETRARPPAPAEGDPVIDMDFTNQRVVAAPAAGDTADQARRDAGLAVPAPRVVAGPSGTKFVVDAPEIPVAKTEAESPGQVKQESIAARVVSRAREAARTVSVRTRANPTGAVVELPTGASAPDAARLAQIDEKEAAKEAKEVPEE